MYTKEFFLVRHSEMDIWFGEAWWICWVQLSTTVVYCSPFLYDTLCTAAAHNSTTKQTKCNNINRHSEFRGTVTNHDWICKSCSYTNNGRDHVMCLVIIMRTMILYYLLPILRATIHKETILTRWESTCDRERDIKCMVHCKSGGVGGLLIALG